MHFDKRIINWPPFMNKVYFRGRKEKTNDRSAENYIPGSSLSGRRSSVIKKKLMSYDFGRNFGTIMLKAQIVKR